MRGGAIGATAVNEACSLFITAPPGNHAALPASSTITMFWVGMAISLPTAIASSTVFAVPISTMVRFTAKG